jgi:hypothetical protein
MAARERRAQRACRGSDGVKATRVPLFASSTLVQARVLALLRAQRMLCPGLVIAG